MKFIITTNKNWTRLAVCALAITSYTHGSEISVNLIKATGAFIVKVEHILSQFFNVNSNVPYKDCVMALGNALTDIENKINHATTETATDTLGTKAYDIAQEARKHFNSAYAIIKQYQDIIKQYKGKGSDHALKFSSDIKRVFSPEIAFNTLTTKLHILHTEAEKGGHSDLIHVIQQLMLLIEKKKAEWLNKAEFALYAGLKVRMDK